MTRVGGQTITSGSDFAAEVRKFLGVPYIFGGESPKGFDCSGLVAYALGRLGIHAPRTSEEQWAWVDRIKESQLQPGDLIFEQWPGDQTAPGHVVIYAGDGKIIQAPAPGQNVQEVPWSVASTTAAGGRVVGYGRVPGLSYSGEVAGPGGAGSAGPGSGATQAQLTSFLTSGSGGVLGDAGALLHGSAVVLDRAFGMFAPGQGWRAIFALTGLFLLYLSWRAFGGAL